MIIAFIGLPGQGKTFGMVNLACKALRSNRRVIANFNIVDAVYGTKNRAEYTPNIGEAVGSASNALFCIDEASIVLPNYYWEKMPFDTLIRFAQVRKYGLDIYYTSQGWNHTVKRLRDLTNYVVKCSNSKLFFTFQYFDPEYFLMKIPKHFEKDYILKTERVYKWQFNKIYKSYNTLETVAQSHLVNSKPNKVDLMP